MSQGLGLRRLQHLVLWVGNVERSVRFSCDVLGFTVQRRYPNAAFLTIPGSGDDHNLGLFEQPGLRAQLRNTPPLTWMVCPVT